MNENRNQDSNFEERLLGELKTAVAQRAAERELSIESAAPSPIRRRAPRLAFGAAAVLAAAAALVAFNSGGDNTPKAFAVEPQEGGGETIKIFSPEDAAGLEGALADSGIRSQVTWLAAGMSCREPRFTASTAKTSAGGTIGAMRIGGPGKAPTIGVMSPQQWQERWQKHASGEISDQEFDSSTPSFSLDPASFASGQTLVISGSRGLYGEDPEGGFEAEVAIAEGPVEPCEPVKTPGGGLLGATNRVVESESARASAE